MIKPWIFEFLNTPTGPGEDILPASASAVFERGMAAWTRMEALDYEGLFFSEHHFGLSYSAAPNLLIAAVAQRTKRMRLGTMGMVLPFYQPWRVLEEIAMLDHLTGGRLEIGCAAGIPQELMQVGLDPGEARERFNEALDIIDAGLLSPVISHHGKYWDFTDLKILPRPVQQPAPPKWTTVVSTGSAAKSAGRGSKICTGFESIARITEIFDAYRSEADRLGVDGGPDNFGLRRKVSIAPSEAEALEANERSKAELARVVAGDPRIGTQKSELIDAPRKDGGFSIDEAEFIAGTPAQVAEQIIDQCRAVGAGHFLAVIGRGSEDAMAELVTLFGEEVNPILRRA